MAFTWIAAGTGYTSFSNVSVYVRHKERKGDYSEQLFHNGALVRLKDRELFITRPGARDYNMHIPLDGFDYAVDADLYGLNSAVKHTGIMQVYTDKKSKRSHSYDIHKLNFPVFIDSGGFQLGMGTAEFIDPVDLCHFANKYGNRCMALDIPVTYDIPEKWIYESAKIQVNNIKIMLNELNTEQVTLYNISHGYTHEQRQKFIDIVNIDDLSHWAIGCAYFGNIFDFIYNVFSAFDCLSHINEFHIFGIANTQIIPFLAWIGKYKNITSDSSSHLQSGICSTVFTIQGNKLKKIGVGRARGETLQTNKFHPSLPCSCNICNSLDSTEVFYHSNNSNITHILSTLHNINVMARYVEIWNDIAAQSDPQAFKKMLSKVYPRKEYKLWSTALDYIEAIVNTDFVTATKRYTSYLTMFHSFKSEASFNLFDTTSNEEAAPAAGEERLKATVSRYRTYYNDKEEFLNSLKKRRKKVKKKKTDKKFKVDENKKKMGIKGATKKRKAKRKKKK